MEASVDEQGASAISEVSQTKSQTKTVKVASIETKNKERDLTDRLEVFFAKRDGIDKVLKIARYSAKIILASSVIPAENQLNHRLKDFDASVGVSRKAFRVGKFLQDYNALKKARLGSKEGFLEIVAYGGEGIYYFVEQLTWLIKAGLIDKRYAARLNKLSAWTEFIGYLGSISLKGLEISALKAEERLLRSKDLRGKADSYLRIKELRDKQVTKMVSIIQDIADALLALADMRDSKDILSNPLLLAFAGLLSALISARKNWLSC